MNPSPETMRARMHDDRGALNDSTITACRAPIFYCISTICSFFLILD